MSARDDLEFEERCPYCQSRDLTRIPQSTTSPVDVFRCQGCGTEFTLSPPRDPEAEPEQLSLSGRDAGPRHRKSSS